MSRMGIQSDQEQRIRLGWVTALLVLATAIISAFLTGNATGSVAQGIEAAAAASGTIISDLATALPAGYAFGAGMVAAVNPCGFALLPAYLGLYLGAGTTPTMQRSWQRNLVRAVWISTSMTIGFVVVFGVAGLVLGSATLTIVAYVPWLGLLVGILLILAGGRMLDGMVLSTTLGDQMAGRLGGAAHQANSRGYFAYGLAYGAASLSCTLPIFLTVVGSALTVGGWGAGLIQFIVYALGMGFVISVLTLSAAVFKSALLARVRHLGRYVQPISALLLLLAGAYIVYYWLTQGGLLATIF